MARAVVLGGGMVGSVIACDLARDADLDVTIVDYNPQSLAGLRQRTDLPIDTQQADCSDPDEIRRVIDRADIVFGALASHLGFGALRTVINAGRHYCDISFMPESALDLDELARERGVTAVVDCGVAPGLSHMMAGRGAAAMDDPRRIVIYVGGIPKERRWPWQYKAGFAPADVVEEYTRPVFLVENGQVVQREALSEPELIDFPGVGTLEAFNTDGLRSLVKTMHVPDMIEKTLRYPGHIELMKVLRAAGLFETEPIDVKGQSVVPRDVFSTLVFPQWTYEPGEADLTVMRVSVEGTHQRRPASYTWDLHDELDPATGFSSMSRTTGFPCAIVGRMILNGSIEQRGVLPPETLGAEEAVFNQVVRELNERGCAVEAKQSD